MSEDVGHGLTNVRKRSNFYQGFFGAPIKFTGLNLSVFRGLQRFDRSVQLGYTRWANDTERQKSSQEGLSLSLWAKRAC